MVSNLNIKITKAAQSKIHPLHRDSIKFGHEFSDHMLICDYKDGKWQTPEILPFGNFSLSPATSFIHYGQAIFEGIKAYRQPDGSVAIFRPKKNFERMCRSAERLDMPPVSEEVFMEGIRQLIELDAQWVPSEPGTSLYIRPFMFGTDAYIGVKTSESYRFAVITSPAAAYYDKPVHIYVQNKYARAVKGGLGFTKAAGNYGASLYPAHLVKKMGYDQILWTDPYEHKYVQEIGTMNVFFVIDGVAVTPDLNDGTILSGVTRRSIIDLLKANNMPVEERALPVEELMTAFDNGKLEEAFGSGTAASISIISDLTYGDRSISMPEFSKWKIVPFLQENLDGIRYGKKEDKYGWLFKVN